MKQCNMPCSGQKNQKCGDKDRLNIFWNGKNATPPVINPGPPGWHSVGCYSDDEDSRTLRQPEGVPGGALNLTVAACVAACKAGGYAVAGVEYGRSLKNTSFEHKLTIDQLPNVIVLTTLLNMPRFSTMTPVV